MSDEPRGCLAAILSLFGVKLGTTATDTRDLPYRRRDDSLSVAELSFYRVLVSAVGGRVIVCPKVNLADVFFVVRPNESHAYRNKIDRKHVDFLLCDPATMQPRCGIELDDSSHGRRDRQERDQFVDEVFKVARLPLLRVPAKAAYSPTNLLAMIEPHLAGGSVAAPSLPGTSPNTALPTCPKCGVPMVKREAKKGPNAGSSFFGCPNYPRCKEIIVAA
jgi:hypothetical protein